MRIRISFSFEKKKQKKKWRVINDQTVQCQWTKENNIKAQKFGQKPSSQDAIFSIFSWEYTATRITRWKGKEKLWLQISFAWLRCYFLSLLLLLLLLPAHLISHSLYSCAGYWSKFALSSRLAVVVKKVCVCVHSWPAWKWCMCN